MPFGQPEPAGLHGGEFRQLVVEFFQGGGVVLQTGAFLGNDFFRRFGNEVLVGELAVDFPDFVFDAGFFFVQPFGFCRDIDLDLEHELEGADDGDGGRGLWQCRHDADVFEFA